MLLKKHENSWKRGRRKILLKLSVLLRKSSPARPLLVTRVSEHQQGNR